MSRRTKHHRSKHARRELTSIASTNTTSTTTATSNSQQTASQQPVPKMTQHGKDSPPDANGAIISPTSSTSSSSSSSSTSSSSSCNGILSKCGMPRAAALSMDTAPVHIDVGGCIYTSSLETLTRFADSRLTKMFNGSIPIVLDGLKQHYFIDRDGKSFRHVLNFMRTGRLVLPVNFSDYDTLIAEAKFYELDEMVLH